MSGDPVFGSSKQGLFKQGIFCTSLYVSMIIFLSRLAARRLVFKIRLGRVANGKCGGIRILNLVKQ